KEKKVVPILIIILVIPTLLLGGIRYGQYNQALEQFITTGQKYAKEFEGDEEDYWKWANSYYDAYLDHTKYEFSMKRTDLAIQLQPDNQIDVKSNLTIKHNGDEPTNEVYLTLYHELEVSNCSSEFAEVTCSREGDLVTVHHEKLLEPGDEFNLSLNYHGNILQYRDDGYIEHSFIQNNRVYLPKEAGWYPLIGERQLVIAHEHDKRFVQFEQRNGRLVEGFPTEFTVEIINENHEIPLSLSIPNVEAGLYQGTSQYGLSLVGGNIK
ncbi:hypothetical protein J4G37_38825, partial [Microvirga sp. 3-52]|nr:hypothetical protein [Microvirga sp. 3-52]